MPDEKANKIWTIGHSTRDLDVFVEMLQSFSIKQLVDIRSLPGSNKFPQYNQEAFSKSLEKNGIKYSYLKKLGGRRKPSAESTNTIWRNKSFRAYADYMDTDSFSEGLNKLEELAKQENTAMMCSEAVWWRCHRSMVSDKMKSEGWKVMHIMDVGKATEHPYTKPASIVDGKLVYGKAEE